MFRIETIFICFAALVFSPLFSTAQVMNKDGTEDCTNPTVIEVNNDQILMISSDEFEAVSMVDNHVVFYKASDQYTFWYKVIINYTCDLQFNMVPSDKSDFYNSYIYKYDGGNFCKAVIDKTLIPYTTNKFEQIHPITATEMDRARKEERKVPVGDDNYLLHKPMQRAIKAVKGEIYYINVHHFVGQDCGHMMQFSSCEKELIVEARHKPCFAPSMAPDSVMEALEKLKSITSIASIAPVSLDELEIKEEAMELMAPIESEAVATQKDNRLHKIEIMPLAIDERTNNSLHADIKIYETKTGVLVGHLMNKEGIIEAELLRNTDYTIEYTSLGYESRKMDIASLIIKDEIKPSRVFLKPKSVGTNIILNNIYFHPNTYVFRNGSDMELRRLLNFLKDNSQVRIEIQGHTNGDYKVKSRAEYSHLGGGWNFSGTSKKLSKLRASEVLAYLVSNGVAPERLSILGLGGQKMIIPDPDDYEDRLVNMRVEIVILEI